MLNFPTWKISSILTICALAILFSFPNFIDKNDRPEFLKNTEINAGLDLQGGAHLLLEVDFDSYFKEKLDILKDEVRNTLRKDRVGYMNLALNESGVSFELRRAEEKLDISSISKSLGNEIILVRDGQNVGVRYSDNFMRDMRVKVLEQSIEIVRRRVDETGTKEPLIQSQGNNRILLQVPGVGNPERLKNLLGKTAKISFHLLGKNGLVERESYGEIGTRTISSIEADEFGAPKYRYSVRKKVEINGESLIDARATLNQAEAVVNFKFDSLGAKKFAKLTTENVGVSLAIVFDNKVISAPVIREPILGGEGIISGSFTIESANDLALLLRAGALPAPLNIIEERTVGPSLGLDSIKAGRKAVVIGIVAVMVFMILSYGLFGIFSNIALIMNIVFITALLSIFGATLTLPGIAGIVLTIGMAVDSNVLIFERIKEEFDSGNTAFGSVEKGFSSAFKTIVDSNITTLVAALVLFYFGSGPVKGFAVTLSIGILTSMFSATSLTRLMVVTWLRKTKSKTIPL
jgi:protein-export membrane protein SecD